MRLRSSLVLHGALVFLLTAGSGACSETLPPPNTKAPADVTPQDAPPADDAFRKSAPAPGPEVVFAPPKIAERKVGQSIRVLVVERHELPIVAVNIVFDRGADQAEPGIGDFMGDMLLSGTKSRSAIEISDEMSRLGADYGAGVDYDGARISGKVLTPKLSGMLDVLADVVINPAFDPKELDRVRSLRVTAIQQRVDSPGRLVHEAMLSGIYPAGHPYQSTLLGTEAKAKSTTRAQLVAFHRQTFSPENMTVTFAGDIDPDAAAAEVKRVFGDWQQAGGKAKRLPIVTTSKHPMVEIIDRAGATQSSVSVAQPGVARTAEDFDALLVMNTILGGQFSSRLNLNLREKHAFTYGARSGFDFRHGPGPFTASAEIFTDKTAPGLKEMLFEIERMRTELCTEQELADAKANLIQQLPARFESNGGTAATLGSLAMLHLPLDEFATRAVRVQRVTREDVQRVAKAHLPADAMRVFIVGDAKVIKPEIDKLDLGEVIVTTVEKP